MSAKMVAEVENEKLMLWVNYVRLRNSDKVLVQNLVNSFQKDGRNNGK